MLSEETSWSARPEPSPDGKQVLFASYHGRQWRQLWLTTPDGAAPLPLTFGEFDRSSARWSPDGERIAYISNEHGNTEPGRPGFRRRRADAGRRDQAALQDSAGAADARHSRRAGPQRPGAGRRARQRRAEPRRRATPGCTPTTASTARCNRPRRIISTARRGARSMRRPATPRSGCSAAFATCRGGRR